MLDHFFETFFKAKSRVRLPLEYESLAGRVEQLRQRYIIFSLSLLQGEQCY